MAHKHASIKDIRKTKKRTVRNLRVKEHIAYLKRKTAKAIEKKDITQAQELYQKLVKSVDKASKRNVLKKNTANRRKSRLIKRINVLKKNA